MVGWVGARAVDRGRGKSTDEEGVRRLSVQSTYRGERGRRHEEAGVRKGEMKLEERRWKEESEGRRDKKKGSEGKRGKRPTERERERERAPTRLGEYTYVLLYFATVIFINQRYSTTSGDAEGWNL